MNKRITFRDDVFLFIPFAIMLVLYVSSSMSYETQSLTSPLDQLLAGRPLENFLSQFEFTYGGSLVSVESSGYISFVEFFIRKATHFFSYFFLGFFWYLGLHKKVNQRWLTVILAILLSVGYASFDELRQVFHPGRTGLLADVMLDTAGAIVGVGIAYYLTKVNWIK